MSGFNLHAHRPPQSAASTSTSSYGQAASPSFPPASLDLSEAEFSLPSNLSESDADDLDARETDSLFDASADEVAERATAFLYGDFAVVDNEDLFKSNLFKRPPLGTEIDKDIAKWMQPRLQSLVQHIDDTEWMYSTPSSFLPVHGSITSVPSCDLPVLASEAVRPWLDDALNVQPGNFDPLADLDANAKIEAAPSDAEAELEMSFSERTGQSVYGLANGQLAREVSLLGV